MKSLLFALALVFAAVPRAGAEFTGTFGMATEIDRLAALLGDEILRDMVCRLSSERYTPASLGAATGLPEGQVLRRLNRLRGWGLVRMVRRDSARTIVEPMPGEGARTLRRWAERYCPTGDGCGRPAGKDGRGRRAGDTGGAASTGEAGDTGETSESLRGKLVTIFGGAGFLGQDLVRHLIDEGANVRVASRRPDRGLFPKTLVDDDRLTTAEFDALDGSGVESAVGDATMVVNLVGLHRDEVEIDFVQAVGRGVRFIAAAAAAAGAERFVNISGISADPDSPFVHGRANAGGEAAARLAFPEVTLVRPSLVVHPDQGFFKELTEMSRFNPDYTRSAAGTTRFQAVYVRDVSEAIVRILKDPATKGRTYELGGPRAIPLGEIVSIVARETGRPAPLLPLWFAEAQAAFYKWLPKGLWKQNLMTTLTRDNIVSPKALGFADLGITPTRIEDMMAARRHHDRDVAGEPAPAY